MDALERKIERATQKEGSRYSLSWYNKQSYELYKRGEIKWDAVQGHSLSLERINGKLIIYDGQGNFYCRMTRLLSYAEISECGMELLRLDNLHINKSNPYLTRIIELLM